MIKEYNVSTLQQADNPPPQVLDYLEFSYQGITLRAYGTLHGITGGLNREYVDFVKDSIRDIDGPRLAEKGMKQLYRGCGIDAELEDWMVLRPIDCLVMGFQLLADPRCLWMITVDAMRERLRRHDPYPVNRRQRKIDLGESPYFHYLDQHARRELVGFLPSNEAIRQDLRTMSRWYGAILPRRRHHEIEHPQWRRILLLERLMHIPCRSIHMLHYAVAYAKRHNHKLVNLFVGETHNTDMHFLAAGSDEFVDLLGEREKVVMRGITERAQCAGGRESVMQGLQLLVRKAGYLSFLLAGAAIALGGYTALWWWISGAIVS